jgi:hypothetical protein
MFFAPSVSAFAHRGAHKRAAVSFLIYSGLLALALLLLAAWLAPDARVADEELWRLSWESYPYYKTIRPELWTTLALADVFAIFVLGAIAFLIAPAIVAATVANERRNGTLDQLRTTPLSPLALAGGLVVGAPARLWLLAAGPLSIHVCAALFGSLPLATLLQSLVVIAVGGAAACGIGLAVALAPRQESGGTFAALGVAGVMLSLSGLAMGLAGDRDGVCWAFVHPAGALDAVMLNYDGLWRRLLLGPYSSRFEDGAYALSVSVTPFASVVAGLVLALTLVRAACRKLAHPDRPLLSKPLALILFALAAATVTGPLFLTRLGDDFGRDSAVPLVYSLLIAPVVMLCGLFATPTVEAWSMGLRRGHPRWHDEAAPPYIVVWLMELGWVLAMLTLSHRHLSHTLDRNLAWALSLTALGALSLPLYLHFANTRFATTSARWGFAVAVLVHCVAQVIAVALLCEHHRPLEGFAQSYVMIASLVAVALPLWIGWRQHVLKRATRLARA